MPKVRSRADSSMLIRFVVVHSATQCFLAVLVKQEIERLGIGPLTSRGTKVSLDSGALALGVATPDDAERGEELRVNQIRGRDGTSQNAR